jgi:predicted nucleic acid-binding protein
MILADTSVWIEHFRSGSKELERALNRGQVSIHPWIAAELALGSLHDRLKTLSMLDMLPQVRVAATNELRHMIETRRLFNLGIGLTDAHLIASALLDPPTLLWTKDKQLRKVAEALQLHVTFP